MAKRTRQYVCQECGAVTGQWAGKCAGCGAWNTIVEEAGVAAPPGTGAPKSSSRTVPLEALDGPSDEAPRISTGNGELDRVTGGGLVPGSAILLGGEPGVGKSTILLQLAAAVAKAGHEALYFTGEEASAQVRMRASRLGLQEAPVKLAAETSLADILATLRSRQQAALVIVDSIQTLWSDAIESAPGSVAQVRAACQLLVRHAKAQGATLVLVGHVTKEGQLAGPKLVEHMVDTVLYFEGDRGRPFRILRATKNRFGATDEIGVFEMAATGLREVRNPSELFLSGRDTSAPGAAVLAGMEGTRPVLVEFQALVSPTSFGTPRRAVVGWDQNRLAMLLAVLEARAGQQFSEHDVYLNVAGGLRVSEPAADLAAGAALLSALLNIALPADALVFGEVALSGSVRPVANTPMRLKEAAKLGFGQALCAPQARGTARSDGAGSGGGSSNGSGTDGARKTRKPSGTARVDLENVDALVAWVRALR